MHVLEVSSLLLLTGKTTFSFDSDIDPIQKLIIKSITDYY